MKGFKPRDPKGTWTYRLELWKQPWHRWLIAWIYHWYDMRIFKVPGFKKLERWLWDRAKGDPLEYIPISARQDLTCYYLTERQRKTLVVLTITEEQYNSLKDHDE